MSIKYFIFISFFITYSVLFAQEEPLVKDDKSNIEIIKGKEGDTIHIKDSGQLEDIVDYKAQTITNDFPQKISELFDDAEVKYQTMAIKADYINIDWNRNLIFGRGKIDENGNIKNKILFTQDGKDFKYESFRFNYKTKEGLAYGVSTIESDMRVDAQKGKKANDSVYYFIRAKISPDEYWIKEKDSLADVHFNTSKGKMINNKALMTGPIHMYIEDFPTPLMLPFLYFPIAGDRSAGILLPSYGERTDLGFFLQNLGFYIPVGQYFDIQITSDIYSKGSWAIHSQSAYKVRYKFSGNFAMDYENRLTGTKGLNDYSKNVLYRVNWSHSQDIKANPNLTFNANVNFSSSQFYREGINNNNLLNGKVLTNTTSSSISINKKFEDLPFNLSLTASHSQNDNSGSVSVNLPTLVFNVNRLYPFAPKFGVKKGLLENFNFDYRLNGTNSINTTTDNFLTSKMFEDMKYGLQHQINLSTNTTLFNYFPINFSSAYKDVWAFETFDKLYNPTTQTVETINNKGFSTYRIFNLSTSTNTTLYGTKIFKDGSLIKAIRHTMQPSIGYSFTPDFSSESWGYYKTYRDAGGRLQSYTPFENTVYGAPSKGLSSSVNFSLQNNLEMKVRNKKDSLGFRKIKLFESLSFSTSYNMVADSLKWSPISINGSIPFFKDKVRLNFVGSVDPYKIVFLNENSTSGIRTDKYGYFTLSNYSFNTNFTLNNQLFGKAENYADKYDRVGEIRYEKYYFDDQDYARFSVPWSLNIGLNYNYSKGTNREGTTNASMSMSATISPSPYWSITANTNYDFETKKLAYTTMTFTRDLRSFSINFSWIPNGPYRTWGFYIGIKASILKDALKYDTKSFNQNAGKFTQ